MKQAFYISRILFFITIMFGIINIIPNGLKENSNLIATCFVGVTLTMFLIVQKRFLFIDILLFLILLISSIGFTNFLIDLFFKPVIPAIDCEGNTPMNMNWLKGFLLGPIYALIISFLYMKNKNMKTITDKSLTIICIVILILSFTKSDVILYFNKQIYQTSIPTLILPEDC